MNETRLDALRKFLEQDPNDAFTRYAIAMEYVSIKNTPEAIRQLNELISISPGYIPAYHQLGLILANTGDTEESIVILKKGIQVAHSAGDAHAKHEMQEALDEIDDES